MELELEFWWHKRKIIVRWCDIIIWRHPHFKISCSFKYKWLGVFCVDHITGLLLLKQIYLYYFDSSTRPGIWLCAVQRYSLFLSSPIYFLSPDCFYTAVPLSDSPTQIPIYKSSVKNARRRQYYQCSFSCDVSITWNTNHLLLAVEFQTLQKLYQYFQTIEEVIRGQKFIILWMLLRTRLFPTSPAIFFKT